MTNNWKNKRVLVCGGAGLIGSHLARRLLKEGAKVTIVDSLSSGSRQNIRDIISDVDLNAEDLRDSEVCNLFSRGKDYVFQLAADMGGIGYITTIGADIMKNSARINLNMLEAARRNKVPNYFYSSSACVYPEYLQKETEVTSLKESDAYPAEPDQFYGWEKLFTEKLCEAYQRDYGMNIKVTRFHNVFGPLYTGFDKDKAKAPCHLIIKAIRHPEPEFELWGDGKQTRSFLYIDDCIEGILKLVESDYNKPINIGSDRLIAIEDLAKMVLGFAEKEVEIKHDLSKPQGVRGRNASLELVERVLHWRPEISLEEGMERTYEWAVEHFDELENI